MITEIKIDKSGRDIFEKDYSIAIVKDGEEVYGVNIPQDIKDKVSHEFNRGSLWKREERMSERNNILRLKIRFHTFVIYLLIKKVLFDMGNADKLSLLVCNDFDGHFHEIKETLFNHLSKLIPSFKKEDIILARFPKPNLLDTAAKNIRANNKKETLLYHLVKLNEEELINLIKK